MTEREITLSHTTGFWWWKRAKQRTFRGSGTVWHDVETGRRPDTHTEFRLSEIDWLEQQKEEQP